MNPISSLRKLEKISHYRTLDFEPCPRFAKVLDFLCVETLAMERPLLTDFLCLAKRNLFCLGLAECFATFGCFALPLALAFDLTLRGEFICTN